MDAILIMVAVLSASPLILLAVHIVVSRLMKGVSPQIAVSLSMLLTYIPVGAVLWVSALRHFNAENGLGAAIFYSFIVYSGIAYSYFHLFNMSETARRIRIFYEIHKAGSLTAAEILSIYGTNDIISVRLERLMAVNQLARKQDLYVMEGRTLYYVALMVRAWGTLLGFSWVK